MAQLRVAIALVIGLGLALGGVASAGPAGSDGLPTLSTPPTMDTGSARLPNMRIDDAAPAPVTPDVDKRPMYLGAGLLVLAGVFWWNRKRRDVLAAHDAAERAGATSVPKGAPASATREDLDER